MASFILSAAIRAVKSRIGVNRAFDSIVDIVPEITRAEWAQAVGEARAALANRVLESTRALNRRPVAAEFGPPLERRSGAKFWQTVEIFVRDRETGARSAFYHTFKTDTLRSRMVAVNDGIERIGAIIGASPDDYPVDIIGFEYTGTYEIVPPRRR